MQAQIQKGMAQDAHVSLTVDDAGAPKGRACASPQHFVRAPDRRVREGLAEELQVAIPPHSIILAAAKDIPTRPTEPPVSDLLQHRQHLVTLDHCQTLVEVCRRNCLQGDPKHTVCVVSVKEGISDVPQGTLPV